MKTMGDEEKINFVDVYLILARSENRDEYLNSAVLSDTNAARLIADQLALGRRPVLMLAAPFIGMTEAFKVAMLGGILAGVETPDQLDQNIEIVTGPEMRQSIAWFVERRMPTPRVGFFRAWLGEIQRVFFGSHNSDRPA